MSRQEFTYNQQRNIWRYVFISMWFSIKVQILQTRWNFVYFIEIFSKELPALIYCSQAGCRPFGIIRSVEQTKCLHMQGTGDKVKRGYQPIKTSKNLMTLDPSREDSGLNVITNCWDYLNLWNCGKAEGYAGNVQRQAGGVGDPRILLVLC